MIKNTKRVVIIMGPPGLGKGTQATLLSERFNLYYLETSKILEECFVGAKPGDFIEVQGEKYEFLKEKILWKTGILCSPPFVSYLMKNKIETLFKEGKGLILSGSPRTLDEGKSLIPFLKKLYGVRNIKVILLEILPRETVFRNSHRKICELMRHSILYSKVNEKLAYCPIDGSKLLKRKGLDDPETIKVRIREYKERTLPLADYFNQQGLRVNKVNGSPAPAVVFKNILKALE